MKHKVFKDLDFDKFADKVTDVNEVVQIFNELYRIRWKLAQYDDIKFFLENYNVSEESRKQILLKFIASFEADISAYTIALLFSLQSSKLFHRLGYLINVMKFYYAEERGLVLVEIVSRFPLAGHDLNVYKTSLEYLFQKKVAYIYKIDPDLLGGFKLRWPSGEIDVSLKRKLNRVKRLIMQGKVA